MTEAFPPHDHVGRRTRARAALAETGVDALLVTDPANVRWLTGFTGSNGNVLLTADTALLVTDSRYEHRVRSEDPALDLLVTSTPLVDVTTWLGDHRVGSLGLESGHVSWAAADRWAARAGDAGMAVIATTDVVEALRMVKDEAELARLRRACRITAEVLQRVLEELAPGRSELDVRAQLEAGFVAAGAEAAAFDSIVASGPNGAVPHHEASDRVLESGDLVTIDCGARVEGYHADCTRTVSLGEPAPELRTIHALVCRAQAAGRAAVIHGAGGRDVDAAARTVIEDAGHGDEFGHGTGHGIGLQIHEAPAIGPRATSTLAAGMTVTVEPGIYRPGVGGVRVEDTVLVSADGPCQILTDLPHELRML